MTLIAAGLAIAALARADFNPVGLYMPDYSKARGKWSSNLRAVFPGSLYIGSDGSFTFLATHREGYWRIHKGRLVLVYSSFFALRFIQPIEVLKMSWPKSELEGNVLDIDPDGALRLKEFGRIGGPLLFRKKPRPSTLDLLIKNSKAGNDDDIEAFVQLYDQSVQRAPDLLRIANDPKQPSQIRLNAAVFLPPGYSQSHSKTSLNVTKATLDLFEHVNPMGLSKSSQRAMRRILGRKIGAAGYAEIMPSFVSDGIEVGLSPTILAEGIANSNYTQGIPLLVYWAHAKSSADRDSACRAFTKMNDKGSLPLLRNLSHDKDPDVRFDAEIAIAKLSDDPEEKLRAIRTFVAMRKGEVYAGAFIAEGLAASGSKLALPYLVDMLENNPDEFTRRSAANALGDLKFSEAVPALMEAKHPSERASESIGELTDKNEAQWWEKFGKQLEKGIKEAVENAPANQAAAEALWKIDHRNKG